MSGARGDNADDLPDTALEEAAIWHARLREAGAEPGGAERAGFEAWLEADARHLRAFRETGRLWDALERPVAAVLAETPRGAASGGALIRGRFRSAPVPVPRLAALAACLLVAVMAGLFWQDDIIVGLRSDYATAAGEAAPLALDDGSRVTLNTDSALAVDFSADRRQVRLLKGEAWFEVSPQDARPFIVETAPGAVRVTGTKFNVRLADDRAVVSLAEGRVELASSEGPEERPVVLAPGQQATVSRAGISAPGPFDEAAVTAWLRGQFVFYDTPLSEVVAALNRYRRGRIVIVDGTLDDLKVSGVFRTDDPDAALAVIGNTLPVRVTRLTDYLVLLR